MTNDDQSGGLFACRPILCVQSAALAIDYYVNTLGFHLGWAWSNTMQRFLHAGESADSTAVGFAHVSRGGVQLMLSEKSQGIPGAWLHLDVDSAPLLDALQEEWKRKGAHIVEPPTIRPWGMYEMRVHDVDGNVLRVSAPPENPR